MAEDGGRVVGVGYLKFPIERTRFRCRHLMIDAYYQSPEAFADDDPLNNEEFFGLQQRFEKLVRYVKFYIKGKQEKRVYLTPRQRERDRLELIYEVLVLSPYIPPFPVMKIEDKDEGTFDCKASDLQPRFLIDTLVEACEKQKVEPDGTTQIAEDITKFYEEIFIPEGGVPLLQENDMQHHFLWVVAECRREVIMFYYSRIILYLASSNSSNTGSEPIVHITWCINTTSSDEEDLIEFERFYDEKADGFKRNAKVLSSDEDIQWLKKWKSGKHDFRYLRPRKTRASENMNPTQEHGLILQSLEDQETKDLKAEEELDIVDTAEERKALEREGSARKEKDKAVEAGVDEFDVMEYERKEKKATGSADKLQGPGGIDLEATMTEAIVQPKVDKPQVQKDRKAGRKGRKPKNSKAKAEQLCSEGPTEKSEIVPSDIDATNEAQMEDKNSLPRKKSKAPAKGNAKKKKQKRRVVEREGSAGREKEQAIKLGVDEFNVIEFEGKQKKLAMEPADKLQGNRDIDLEATKIEPFVQPKVGRLQVQKDRKPGRKGRKPKKKQQSKGGITDL